ncbi:MAG TPA: NTTRR-F1 domain [Bacillota bacterium]|nr:NTTRR-F1 domain [Bacillota bacterium]
MAVSNLLINGGFERGSLDGWIGNNAYITASYSHSGQFSANISPGSTPSSLVQTVPITDSGQNYQLLVSLAKYGFFQSPALTIRVSYLNSDNIEVGTGGSTIIIDGSLPNVLLESWKEIYLVTDVAPAAATQVQVEIAKLAGRFYTSNVLVDDVALLAFTTDTTPPGPTGPTGP